MYFLHYILCAFVSISHAKPIVGDDMMLSRKQMHYLTNTGPRNVMEWNKYYWPKSTLVYSFRKGIKQSVIRRIAGIMRNISAVSCIKFRRTFNPKEPQLVIQTSNPGCYCTVGYQGRKKKMIMNIGNECNEIVLHELMHSLAFIHMHSVPKRDNYVKIHKENIIEKELHNFEIRQVNDFGMGYDYSSVMHYPRKAFSRNGKDTITPLQKGVKIGEKHLSPKDIIMLKRVYCQY